MIPRGEYHDRVWRKKIVRDYDNISNSPLTGQTICDSLIRWFLITNTASQSFNFFQKVKHKRDASKVYFQIVLQAPGSMCPRKAVARKLPVAPLLAGWLQDPFFNQFDDPFGASGTGIADFCQ